MRTVVLAVLSLVLAGCGSGAGGGATASKDPKAVFKGKCGQCHALEAAGTTGSFGPDLDALRPDRATVVTQIRNGGGGMPRGLLKGAEAEAMAKYVSSVAGR